MRNLASVGGLVDTALAARLEFEMLDRVGHISARPFESGASRNLVEQLARRAEKGAAGQVLLIARLFPDDHQRGVCRAFAGDRLRRVFPERAAAAGGKLRFQRLACIVWPSHGLI